jgi:AcrR family transcriptional regulator
MTAIDKTSQLYEEAIKVFAHYGYQKASMGDIAKRMGMTKSNLYFYCENKHDLYEKAVAHALLRWQDRVLRALESETDIVERFMTLATKAYEYLEEDSDLRALIINDPDIQAITPAEERFPAIGRAAYTLVRETLRQAIDEKRFRSVDVDQVAGFLYSVYSMFIIKTYVKAEGHTAGEMYRAGIELILKGLLAESGHNE